MLLARPVDSPTAPVYPEENDLAEIVQMVDRFRVHVKAQVNDWHSRLNGLIEQGRHAAIWGSGSKCVSFLSALGVPDEAISVVDINPHRHGKFLAGSGKQVMAPDSLRTLRPDVVFAMNPIYSQEIQRDLDAMGVDTELIEV